MSFVACLLCWACTQTGKTIRPLLKSKDHESELSQLLLIPYSVFRKSRFQPVVATYGHTYGLAVMLEVDW